MLTIIESGPSTWALVATDGELRVFSREESGEWSELPIGEDAEQLGEDGTLILEALYEQEVGADGAEPGEPEAEAAEAEEEEPEEEEPEEEPEEEEPELEAEDEPADEEEEPEEGEPEEEEEQPRRRRRAKAKSK